MAQQARLAFWAARLLLPLSRVSRSGAKSRHAAMMRPRWPKARRGPRAFWGSVDKELLILRTKAEEARELFAVREKRFEKAADAADVARSKLAAAERTLQVAAGAVIAAKANKKVSQFWANWACVIDQASEIYALKSKLKQIGIPLRRRKRFMLRRAAGTNGSPRNIHEDVAAATAYRALSSMNLCLSKIKKLR
jgi:hypothetical protein